MYLRELLSKVCFDFQSPKNNVKRCRGYFLGITVPTEEGVSFIPKDFVIDLFVGSFPEFEKLENLCMDFAEITRG